MSGERSGVFDSEKRNSCATLAAPNGCFAMGQSAPLLSVFRQQVNGWTKVVPRGSFLCNYQAVDVVEDNTEKSQKSSSSPYRLMAF
jgi:hypothetical protein